MTTATTPTTAGTTARAGRGRIATAAVLAAVLTGAVNSAVAVAAVAVGVTAVMPLNPPIDIAFSVLASIAGAIGWTIVNRRADDPRRVMAWLAPLVLLVSFVPDVLLAVATASSTGIAPILALSLMHVTTIVIAIGVYARLLPLKVSPAAV